MKTAIAPVHADSRKLDAMHYLGLLERDGANVKLTDEGQAYAKSSDEDGRAAVLRRRIAGTPLYRQTVEWIHFQKKVNPTRNEVANYWNDHHAELIEGAAGAALTDGAIFFLRLADAAKLGKYITAGNRREAHLETDQNVIKDYIENLGNGPVVHVSDGQSVHASLPPTSPPPPPPGPPPSGAATWSTSPAIHINVEIHIAADAKPTTVEEIFKNMRKYVLLPPKDDGEVT